MFKINTIEEQAKGDLSGKKTEDLLDEIARSVAVPCIAVVDP